MFFSYQVHLLTTTSIFSMNHIHKNNSRSLPGEWNTNLMGFEYSSKIINNGNSARVIFLFLIYYYFPITTHTELR